MAKKKTLRTYLEDLGINPVLVEEMCIDYQRHAYAYKGRRNPQRIFHLVETAGDLLVSLVEGK